MADQEATPQSIVAVQQSPADAAPIQVPSSQQGVSRKYKGIMFTAFAEFNGEKDVFKGGEVWTLFKDKFADKKGVTLSKLSITYRTRCVDKELAICFCSSSESVKTLEDVSRRPNAMSFIGNPSTKNVFYDRTMLMPEGLGMQVYPGDRDHPQVHMWIAAEKGFVGSLRIHVTYDCDSLYSTVEDFWQMK